MTVRSGTVIESPPTKERIRFLKTAADTGGEYLELEHTFGPGGAVALEHIHPNQRETFHVLQGTPRFLVDGSERGAKPGETLVVEPGVAHLFGNPTGAETVVRIEIRPALKSEEMFDVLYALVRAGRCNRRSIPKNPFVAALYAQTFKNEVAPAGALLRVARKLSPLAAALARMFRVRLPAS